MHGIRKTFPGIVANDGVELDVEKGEIHALVGENGAGKTTLMNILYGLCEADAGTIRINGEAAQIRKNAHAISLGIGMVHQNFKLVPSFTVEDNIVLGAEPARSGLLDRRAIRKSVLEISNRFGLKVDPDSRIEHLPVGVRQRVEILKTLYRNAAILILDEPTAVLTPQETRDLFAVIRRLVQEGKTVIFVSHKLQEVMDISDRVTVMRDGKVVATRRTEDTNPTEISRMMVGRDVLLKIPKAPSEPLDAVLQVQGLWVLDDRSVSAVRGISFEVRRGEILGIAGVEGNGQRELVEAIVGLRSAVAGRIHIAGEDVTTKTVRYRRELGVGCVPEDRYVHGLALHATVEENLVGTTYFKSPMSRRTLLNMTCIGNSADCSIRAFDIRCRGRDVPAHTLSGGNLQKVLLARELSAQPRLVVAAQPTRGLDIAATEFVRQHIVSSRDKGAAVLLVSAELAEVMSLSDRIAVLYEGRIVGTIRASEASEDGLGLWMAGITG
jgi:simple sugar transport system ATP-binding protein